MAKLLGRIPASQVSKGEVWSLPSINLDEDNGSKLFRLKRMISSAQDKSATVKAGMANKTMLPSAKKDVPGVGHKVTKTSDSLSISECEGSLLAEGSLPAEGSLLAEGSLPAEGSLLAEGSTPKSTEEGIDDETKGYLAGEAKGFEAGESAGREQGLRDVRAELEKSFDDEIKDKRTLMTNLLSLFQTPPDRKDEIESSLVALITQVAEVVILSELKANPELIGRLVNHAMAALPHGARNLKIQVNPSNVKFLQAEMSDQNIEYLANRNLSIGSCQIQSETSSVDAMLAERIHDSLVKVFSSDSVEATSESTLLNIGDEIDSEC